METNIFWHSFLLCSQLCWLCWLALADAARHGDVLPSVLRRYIHLSLVPALIVAAPEVKVSPSALSRVGLTPEIKAAHPAQSSRTLAHQNQKVTSWMHPFIFGTLAPIHLSSARFHPSIVGTHLRYQNWYFFIRVLSAFYLALEKIPRFHRKRYKVRIGTSDLLCQSWHFGQVNSSSDDFG